MLSAVPFDIPLILHKNREAFYFHVLCMERNIIFKLEIYMIIILWKWEVYGDGELVLLVFFCCMSGSSRVFGLSEGVLGQFCSKDFN